MATLISVVALGVLFAVFATQNTALVSLNIGTYVINQVPLYFAILVPLLIGLLLAFLFHIFKDLSRSLTINEQKDEIKKLKKEIAEVTKDAHKFQLENTKIKSENDEPADADSI